MTYCTGSNSMKVKRCGEFEGHLWLHISCAYAETEAFCPGTGSLGSTGPIANTSHKGLSYEVARHLPSLNSWRGNCWTAAATVGWWKSWKSLEAGTSHQHELERHMTPKSLAWVLKSRCILIINSMRQRVQRGACSIILCWETKTKVNLLKKISNFFHYWLLLTRNPKLLAV